MYFISGRGWTVYRADARDTLRAIAPGSVHTLVTSPPYWGMREYPTPRSVWGGDPDHVHQWGDVLPGSSRGGSGTPNGRNNRGEGYARAGKRGQYCGCGAWLGTFGNEPTVEQYVRNTVEIFRAIRGAMRTDGVVWWNIGDSYIRAGRRRSEFGDGNLAMIPARVAIALQEVGFYLRQDIVWNKPDVMPEPISGREWRRCRVKVASGKFQRWDEEIHAGNGVPIHVGDADGDHRAKWQDCPGCPKCKSTGGYVLRSGGWRPTSCIEHVLLLTLSPNDYFADAMAVSEPAVHNRDLGATRNPRAVWTIPKESYRGKHFAAFPRRLVWNCIAGTTSPAGVCRLCGAQYAPVVDVQRIATRPGLDNKFTGVDSAVAGKRDLGRHISIRTCHGYRPTCGCPAGEPIGAIVCDPFLGRVLIYLTHRTFRVQWD